MRGLPCQWVREYAAPMTYSPWLVAGFFLISAAWAYTGFKRRESIPIVFAVAFLIFGIVAVLRK